MSELMIAVVASAIAIGVLTFYVGNGVLRARRSSSRRLASLQTRDEVLSTGISERAIAPVIEGLGKFALRFTPQGWVNKAQKKLVYAGMADRMDGNTWAAFRIMALIGVLVMFFVVQSAFGTPIQKLMLFGVLMGIGFVGPEAILNRRIDERRKEMEKSLPDLIDLLVISVEAGLGFEAAMGRVTQAVPGELSREFTRTLQETRVGVSRHKALRALAERTDVDDLNAFVLALIQADQFGVSIARMLRVQADEMRVRRRQRAQEKAFAAPVKLVFPLVLCIFPSMFVVLLGPAAINIATVFGGDGI
ncbi:MAG: type II secretion system F family protein [Acidobacteria bacterium]|nr:type II secretion system F family protein [Acidobacteriota bacterium]